MRVRKIYRGVGEWVQKRRSFSLATNMPLKKQKITNCVIRTGVSGRWEKKRKKKTCGRGVLMATRRCV